MLGGFFGRQGLFADNRSVFDERDRVLSYNGKLEGMVRLSDSGRTTFVGEQKESESRVRVITCSYHHRLLRRSVSVPHRRRSVHGQEAHVVDDEPPHRRQFPQVCEAGPEDGYECHLREFLFGFS